jgi:hypothetical protein
MSRCATALGRMDMTSNELSLNWASDVHLQSYADLNFLYLFFSIFQK